MKLTHDREAMNALARDYTRQSAQRVYHSAKEFARERFELNLSETEDGFDIAGGEGSMEAEYGTSPDTVGDGWGLKSVMGAADGRA